MKLEGVHVTLTCSSLGGGALSARMQLIYRWFYEEIFEMSGRTPKFFGSISPCLLDSMELSGSACVATVYGGAGPLLDTKWVGLRGRMLEGHFYNRSLDWIFFFSNISGDIFEWGYSKSGSGRTF